MTFLFSASPRLARPLASAGALGLAFALAGCMSIGSGPRPLPATPTTPVASASLPQPVAMAPATLPAPGTLAESAAEQAAAEAVPALASVDPAAAAAVTEDDLVGAWSATTPSATCGINLSLTSWTGGYRASTRNCGDVQLATLSAWAVEGQQVTLKGTDGATLARLYRTGGTRYAGQLESGQAITVFR